MLCEKCNKNQAVTHIRQNINGVQSEMHLCENCAAQITEKIGGEYGKFFSDFGFGIDSMLGSLFGQDFLTESLLSAPEEKCEMCGATLSSIKKTGNVGCKQCYETFREQLMPLIQRIHGKTTHNGRIPSVAEEKISVKNKIDDISKQLKNAIETENFEQAARLRDELKSLREQL